MGSPVLLRYWKEILILCVILAIKGITGQVSDPCKGQCGPGTKCTQTGMCACETGFHRFSVVIYPDKSLAYCFETCDRTSTGCAPNNTCAINLQTGQPFCKCDDGFSRSPSGKCLRDKADVLETTTDAVTSSTDNGVTPEATPVATNETISNPGSTSPAQIAGIVVGVIVALVVLAIIIVIAVIFLRRGRAGKENVTVSAPVPVNGNSADSPAVGITNPDYKNADESEMWNPDSYSVLPMHVVSSFKSDSPQSTDQDSNSNHGNTQNPYTEFDLSSPPNTNISESQT